MNNKKIRALGAGLVAAVWLGLTGFAWFGPPKERSEAERRPLEQMPQVSTDSVLNGSFMKDFESYSLDQFPLRDRFRQLKALFHYNALMQSDNNGYYFQDGYIATQELHTDDAALDKKLEVLNQVYDRHIAPAGGKCYVSVVPDKGYYLSQMYGYPSLDYEALFEKITGGMPWAKEIDIRDTLELSDYYRTDTHWRQEMLLPTAQRIAQGMGVDGPRPEDFTAVRIEQPFYGVYYGQAALPLAPDEMYILESELLTSLKITVEMSYEADIYDRNQLQSDDQYNIYLSGAKKGYVTVENPNAKNDRKLVIFRDSFGSSMAPLLVQDYSAVTLIDLRVFNRMGLGQVDFAGADVLFLLSSLAMNNADEAFK